MPVFEYTALNNKGKSVSGILDCESAKAARQKLRTKGVYPVKLTELADVSSGKGSGKTVSLSFFNKVKSAEIAMMTRQLSTLLGAGFPLVSAIETLIPQTATQAFRKVLSHVKDSIEEGGSLAGAFGEYPNVFSEIYINMVRAGEASGTLEIVLERLADISENQLALTKKVQTALIYPAFMTVAGSGVLFVMMTFIVPKLTSIFTETGSALPTPTKILIATSDFLSAWWWLLAIILVLLISGFSSFRKSKKGRYVLDRIVLGLPLFGDLAAKLAAARFARTLGSLLENGVSLMNALEVVKNVIGNVILSEAVEEAAKEVEQGHELGVAIEATGAFPYLSVQMIKVGEQSGELENMLNKVADVYENEVESTLTGLTTLLEPIIILAMAVVVGFIIFSICLPIFEMNELVK
jgi:general secretion pathway protein F